VELTCSRVSQQMGRMTRQRVTVHFAARRLNAPGIAQGWMYAVDFEWFKDTPQPGEGECHALCYVRRRRWVRRRRARQSSVAASSPTDNPGATNPFVSAAHADALLAAEDRFASPAPSTTHSRRGSTASNGNELSVPPPRGSAAAPTLARKAVRPSPLAAGSLRPRCCRRPPRSGGLTWDCPNLASGHC
jgi:hypothetical protein